MDDQTFQVLAARALAGKCGPEETARLKEALEMSPDLRERFQKLRRGRQFMKELLSLLDPAPCVVPEFPEHLRGLLNAEVRRQFPKEGKSRGAQEKSREVRPAMAFSEELPPTFSLAASDAPRPAQRLLPSREMEETLRLMEEARNSMTEARRTLEEAMRTRAEAEQRAERAAKTAEHLRGLADQLIAVLRSYERRLEDAAQGKPDELRESLRQGLETEAAGLSGALRELRGEIQKMRSQI